jgi:hypothetical protein
MNYDEFFADAIGRLGTSGAIACSPTSSGSRANFRGQSGIRPKARVRSWSGAPTIISAWASIRK